MTPVSLHSPMTSHAVNAYRSAPTPVQLPATPEALPASPAPADGVHLSDRARALSARAVAESPVAATALSSNEKVDAMATSVYASRLSMQAIETYSETYQMASERYYPVDEATA